MLKVRPEHFAPGPTLIRLAGGLLRQHMAGKAITARHAAFIAEYRHDRHATRAYAAVYPRCTPNAARNAGPRLLQKPEVAAEIARLDAMHAEKLGIDTDRLLTEAWHIVTADPRELVEFYTGACRHCWGEGFKFQRTIGEYNAEFADWTEKKGKDAAAFDQKGGIGYDPLRDPNKACPECAGAGTGRAVIKDTRRISKSALALYAGVKQTKEGVEVRMHSKLDALEKLFRHAGLYQKDNEQQRTPLGEALAGFVKNLHEQGVGRLPFVAQANIRRVK